MKMASKDSAWRYIIDWRMIEFVCAQCDEKKSTCSIARRLALQWILVVAVCQGAWGGMLGSSYQTLILWTGEFVDDGGLDRGVMYYSFLKGIFFLFVWLWVPMYGSSVLECTTLRPVEKLSIRFLINGPLRGIVGEKCLMLCLGNNNLWAEIEKLIWKVYFVSWNHV